MSTGVTARAVYDEVAAEFRAKSFDEWVAALSEEDIPFEPVLTPSEAIGWGLESGREAVMRSKTAEGTEIAVPGRPWLSSSVLPGPVLPAPELDEH